MRLKYALQMSNRGLVRPTSSVNTLAKLIKEVRREMEGLKKAFQAS